MSNIAIRVENIGKRYRRGADVPYQRFSELLQRLPAAALGAFRRQGDASDKQDFWALKDVSFDVKEGEVLGVIGRNGAGKSTLLKILSRITEPTTGRFGVRGRLASLLEVGTGFHPELTGRENIFLSGAILGMSRAEIKRHFDEIVAFAEIDAFLDTPVKRYSSGMYVRLGFAIAAHLQPEILIVDEVLAVGDAAFQKKCLGKMGEVAESGRTVLFVSHNLTAVKSLCTSVLLLTRGKSVRYDSPQAAADSYLNSTGMVDKLRSTHEPPPGSRGHICSVECVAQEEGESLQAFPLDETVRVNVAYEVHVPNLVLNVSLSVLTIEGTCVFSSPSLSDSDWCKRPHPAGKYVSQCEVPADFLNTGLYRITVVLVEDGSRILHQVDDCVEFQMCESQESRHGFFGTWSGVVRPQLKWRTERVV